MTYRQRKHHLTMGPIHPDAEDAILILLGIQPNERELAPHEVEEAITVEQEHLNDIPQPQAEEDDDITEAMF